MSVWEHDDLADAKFAVWAEDDWESGIGHCRTMIGLHHLLGGGVVLDVGCGVVRLLVPFAVEYPAVAFVGVDPSPAMLRHAEARLERWSLTNATVVASTAAMVAGSVAVAYSVLVIQHLDRGTLRDMLGDVRRVLGDGGVFRFQFVETGDVGPVNHPVTVNEMGAMLTAAGFDHCTYEYDLRYPTWTWCTAR